MTKKKNPFIYENFQKIRFPEIVDAEKIKSKKEEGFTIDNLPTEEESFPYVPPVTSSTGKNEGTPKKGKNTQNAKSEDGKIEKINNLRNSEEKPKKVIDDDDVEESNDVIAVNNKKVESDDDEEEEEPFEADDVGNEMEVENAHDDVIEEIKDSIPSSEELITSSQKDEIKKESEKRHTSKDDIQKDVDEIEGETESKKSLEEIFNNIDSNGEDEHDDDDFIPEKNDKNEDDDVINDEDDADKDDDYAKPKSKKQTQKSKSKKNEKKTVAASNSQKGVVTRSNSGKSTSSSSNAKTSSASKNSITKLSLRSSSFKTPSKSNSNSEKIGTKEPPSKRAKMISTSGNDDVDSDDDDVRSLSTTVHVTSSRNDAIKKIKDSLIGPSYIEKMLKKGNERDIVGEYVLCIGGYDVMTGSPKAKLRKVKKVIDDVFTAYGECKCESGIVVGCEDLAETECVCRTSQILEPLKMNDAIVYGVVAKYVDSGLVKF